MAHMPVQQPKQASFPRLYSRQRLLLGLLDAIGGDVSNTDFQKLLFLYCKERSAHRETESSQGLYDFVPFRFGAFSFTCYADRPRLAKWGLIAEDDQKWVLTEDGSNLARESENTSIRAFANRYRSLRGNALVANTYRRYPYYAIHSEIAEQVLQDDRRTIERIESNRTKATPSRLFTIGYEGRTLESYLNLLIREGATLLCDVRRNAISRKYGFSKTALERSCAGVGIRYEHLPDLGIESSLRRGLKSEADFKNLFKTYEQTILPNQGDALEKIRAWLRSGESVALTCFELKAGLCHRHCVANALEKITNQVHSADPDVGPLLPNGVKHL
ncbi:MAG: DUF488 family protein [Gemmatimonadota bacterium]|nr:DUF488 family protein [Gemmatimonadota bacterium]